MEEQQEADSSLNETEERVDFNYSAETDVTSLTSQEVSLQSLSTLGIHMMEKHEVIEGGLENTRCLLSKPHHYGFQRVCQVKSHAGEVVNVTYLGPVNKEGRRKTIQTRVMVGKAIRNFEKLKQANFCFKQVKYNLSPEFEVEKLHLKPNVSSPLALGPGRSIYNEFLIEKPPNGVGGAGGRLVQCKLCGVEIRRYGFSRHMKRFHLPDETCSTCGLNFKPYLLPSHIVKCLSDGKKQDSESVGSCARGNVKTTFSSTDIKLMKGGEISNTLNVLGRKVRPDNDILTHQVATSCGRENIKMAFSSTDETSLRKGMVLSSTPNLLRSRGDSEDEKMGIEDKGEVLDEARVKVKLVTVGNPSKSLKLESSAKTKFKRILDKLLKKMKLTHVDVVKCRQGGRELTGEEMVKNLSREPVMIEMRM